MKLVRENIEFKRGLDPKSSLQIGDKSSDPVFIRSRLNSIKNELDELGIKSENMRTLMDNDEIEIKIMPPIYFGYFFDSGKGWYLMLNSGNYEFVYIESFNEARKKLMARPEIKKDDS